jgi:hypothetical protein
MDSCRLGEIIKKENNRTNNNLVLPFLYINPHYYSLAQQGQLPGLCKGGWPSRPS